MRVAAMLFLFGSLFFRPQVHASIFGQIKGQVRDAQHRPIRGARVTIKGTHSALAFAVATDERGEFTVLTIPLGDYVVAVQEQTFGEQQRVVTLQSETLAELRFELVPGTVTQTVQVRGSDENGLAHTAVPTTLVDRQDIAATPGADRTNSLAMLTSFVPGAYMTHDMLHMRGGHQVSWLIDGVQIPNTNIASNLGAQIDPKDIGYVEIQRGSYTADVGDRTYGAFNVVPRSGFERNREGELVLTAGSFFQTDQQISLGDHTEKFAYYASLNGNRSDYGLSTPVAQIRHDAANGFGGFLSAEYKRTAQDQFRLVAQIRRDFFQIPYDPDPQSFGNQQFDSSSLRDGQHEVDGLTALSWLHTFQASTVLQVSPFVHYNRAAYQPGADTGAVATTAGRSSLYAGGQASVTTDVARNTVQVGAYGFGQHDSSVFGAVFNDNSGNAPFQTPGAATGGVAEEYASDSVRATQWLTFTAGVRATHFLGQLSESAVSPRFGAAVRVPRLHWVFRGFYGRFYQPPPLLTAAGPVVQFAQANNTDFEPLRGERDEEHQFGVQVPLRGWVLDVDTFRTRAKNFLDHSNIGESSLYFPVTIDGALVRAWEVSLRSPRLGRLGQAHLAYSNQIAQQRGGITGGLVCVPVGDPACQADFVYTPVDHDQRNTLSVGGTAMLPAGVLASANVAYGSGFVNGSPDAATPYPNAYLPQHTSVDMSLSRSIGERATVSVTALNVANRRVLLDNSLTFGGFHFNDPRAIYGEVRYRFRY